MGVGQDEDPLSSLRGSDIGRTYARPLRIEPERGQVSENVSKPRKEACDVFQEHVSGSNRANDSDNFSPEAGALAIDPGAGSGDGNVLTRETRSDDIHAAAPSCAVEGSDVAVDRSLVQVAVFHARRQDAGSKKVDLHITDDARRWKSCSNAEVETSDAGEEGQHVEGSRSHKSYAPPHNDLRPQNRKPAR